MRHWTVPIRHPLTGPDSLERVRPLPTSTDMIAESNRAIAIALGGLPRVGHPYTSHVGTVEPRVGATVFDTPVAGSASWPHQPGATRGIDTSALREVGIGDINTAGIDHTSETCGLVTGGLA